MELNIHSKDIVFINGHARAGTTWLAELLTLCCNCNYLFEPFSSASTYFSGIDSQTIIKKCRYVQLGKRGHGQWELLSERFFLDENSPYSDSFVPLISHHLDELIGQQGTGLVMLIKQPRIESHYLFRKLLGVDAKFIFIDRDPMGIIDSHAYGGFWDWVEEDWHGYLSGEGCVENCESLLKEASANPWRKLYLLIRKRKEFMHKLMLKGEARLVRYEDLCESPEALFSLAEEVGFNADTGAKRRVLEKYAAGKSSKWELITTDRNTILQAEQWKHRLPSKILNDLRKWDYFIENENVSDARGDCSVKTYVKLFYHLERHRRRMRFRANEIASSVIK